MEKNKLAQGMKKIEDGVVKGYKGIEEGVVKGYKGIENGVVNGFTKITDKFVDTFLTQEGESVEDAKARLAQEQADREAAGKAIVEKNRAETEKRVAEASAKAHVPQINVPGSRNNQ